MFDPLTSSIHFLLITIHLGLPWCWSHSSRVWSPGRNILGQVVGPSQDAHTHLHTDKKTCAGTGRNMQISHKKVELDSNLEPSGCSTAKPWDLGWSGSSTEPFFFVLGVHYLVATVTHLNLKQSWSFWAGKSEMKSKFTPVIENQTYIYELWKSFQLSGSNQVVDVNPLQIGNVCCSSSDTFLTHVF